MAQLVYRQDTTGPVADAIQRSIERARQEQLQRSAEEDARRRKTQRLTAMGAGALAGAVALPLLAPTIGLAGAAASLGIPSTEAALATTAATTGLFGAGGALTLGGGLAAGLAGGAIGAQAGGAFQQGDIAGGLGAVANPILGRLAHNEARAERLSDAQTLDRSSTDQNIRQAIETAKALQPLHEQAAQVQSLSQRAVELNMGLSGAELYAMTPPQRQRAFEEGRHVQETSAIDLESRKSNAAYEQTIARMIGTPDKPGDYQMEPDQRLIDSTFDERQQILDDARTFDQSGGRSGRPLWENADRLQRIEQQVRQGVQGRPRPKPPQTPIYGPDGKQTGSRPIQGDFELANGDRIISTLDPKTGEPHTITMKGTPPDPIERIRKMAPGPARDEAVRSEIRSWGANAGEEDQYTLQHGGGIERKKSASEEQQTDLFKSIGTAVAKGEISPEQGVVAMRTMRNAQLIDPLEKKISDASLKIGAGSIGPDTYIELRKQAEALYGTALTTSPGLKPVNDALTAIGMDAKENALRAQAAAMAQQIGPPPPPLPAPPPGSAASAEQILPSQRLKAERLAAPDRAALQAAAAATKRYHAEQERQAAIAERQAADYEELALKNVKESLREKYKQPGYQLGQNPPLLTAIKANGERKQFFGNELTPSFLAKLKAEGWTFPGMEGE